MLYSVKIKPDYGGIKLSQHK